MILRAEPAKGGQYTLYGDDEVLLTVPADAWFSLDYTDGQTITDEQAEALVREFSVRRAYARALSLLTRRAHSEAELTRKLRAGFSAEIAAAAVEKCRDAGFVDDDAFAADFAAELANNKLFGPGRIRAELAKRGVPRGAAERAIGALDADFGSQLARLIEKKFPDAPQTPAEKRRFYAAMARYGYDGETVRGVLSDAAYDEEAFPQEESL